MIKSTAGMHHPQQWTYPKFKDIEHGDRPVITEFVNSFKVISCEYSFANLYCWRDNYKVSWCIHKERLLIYDNINKHLFMPVGEYFPPEELAAISSDLEKIGMTGDFGTVPPEYILKYPEVTDFYSIEEDRSLAEYIYSVEKLSELKGSKLHKKRNLIAQFCRSYPDYSVLEMDTELRQLCLKKAESILAGNMKISRSIREEHSALKEAFRNFDASGLEGLVIMVDHKPVAFSIFSRISDAVYDTHFEKSDHSFKGAAQLINRETAEYLKGRCQYINREQDLGLEGLRKAKLSYDPQIIFKPSKLLFKNKS